MEKPRLHIKRKTKNDKQEEYLRVKKTIFEKYYKIKNGEILLDNLDIGELEKIKIIMEEELKIKQKRLEKILKQLEEC